MQPFFRNTMVPLDSVSPVFLSHQAKISTLVSVSQWDPCYKDGVFFPLQSLAAQGGTCNKNDGVEDRKDCAACEKKNGFRKHS